MNRRSLLIGGGAVLALAGAGVAASFATMGSADDYAKAMAALRAPLGNDVRDVVRFATLAANGHNTQPWRFKIGAREMRIMPDFSRRTPAVDPDDHHLYVSLGCAAENMVLAAWAHGLIGEAEFDLAGDGAVVLSHVSGRSYVDELCDAIPKRQSTRADFDGRAVAASDLAKLEQAAQMPGVALALITERPQIDRVRDLIIASNTAQMADAAFVRELRDWMRFNPGAALSKGDGLFSASSGNPMLPSWIGEPMFDMVFKADAENAKYVKQLDTSAGVAVFTGQAPMPVSWYQVGRACQRFALQATALGLKCSFVNQPVEVAAMRPELAALVGLPGRRPDIVMRFGYGDALPMSARRPVDAVIDA